MDRIFNPAIAVNEQIASNIYRITLAQTDYPKAMPGQFACLYLNDPSRLLPRPLGICEQTTDSVTFVYAVKGAGTRILSEMKPGERLRLGPPSGHGFTMEEAIQSGCAALIAGGIGAPPLLLLAHALKEKSPGIRIRAVLGFRSEPFLTDAFARFCETYIATDDGSVGFHGNAADLARGLGFGGNEPIYACGPEPLLDAVCKIADEKNAFAEVSLEARMGCGYGACYSCSCETTHGRKKICCDGPVFRREELNRFEA